MIKLVVIFKFKDQIYIRLMLQLVVTTFFLFISPKAANAEPWLANRYAQNCSACHSPNRNNVPLLQRRCTLSCQGCHVNPSGGGMRNRYGEWNQNRFLRSAYWPKLFHDYKMPAVVSKQLYYTDPNIESKRLARAKLKKQKEEKLRALKETKDKKKKKKGKGSEENIKPDLMEEQQEEKVAIEGDSKFKMSDAEIVNIGLPLVTADNLTYKEEDYHDHVDWRVTPDRNGFMRRLTKNDPLREEINMHVQASGDFRYFMIKRSGDGAAATYKDKWISFLMSADLDLRLRPTKRFWSFVFETRYMGNPTQDSLENTFVHSDNKIMARSAYLLIDEIPFNTYLMAGFYRPMFGHYTPDHTALAQVISKFGQSSQYKALSLGTAPNVPFLYVHKIMPHENAAADPNALKGNDALVVNLGGRFVTLGLSGMLSIWRGKYKSGTTDLANNMTSLTFGGFFKNTVLNFEILRVEREYAPGSKDAGVVYTLESKYKFWRENYGVFNYAFSNINTDMKEGDASQIGFGVKSFLYSGLELELMYVMDSRNKITASVGTETKYNTIQGQVHMFF